MPVTSGLTTFGIIRKRMSDLYLDFARRIKEGGAFGVLTTADNPDDFPTDPLVQLMATASASAHELWEATEFFYNQLDPATASGRYLDYLHGSRLNVIRGATQSDESYRSALFAAMARPSRVDITTVAAARADIDCAVLLTHEQALLLGPAPDCSGALVVKGCGIDYEALAEDIYEYVELGTHQLYGDTLASFTLPSGGCVTYPVVEAEPVFVALRISGYFSDVCRTNIIDEIRAVVLDALEATFAACTIGAGFNTANVIRALGTLPEFTVTDVRMARRARELFPDGCPLDAATLVEVCGVEMPWATSETCGKLAGEVWCEPNLLCLDARPWEYVAFALDFIEVVEDATQGGCL